MPKYRAKEINDAAASCNTELARTYALLHPDKRGQTFSRLFIKQVSRRHLKTLQEFQFAHLDRSTPTHHTYYRSYETRQQSTNGLHNLTLR